MDPKGEMQIKDQLIQQLSMGHCRNYLDTKALEDFADVLCALSRAGAATVRGLDGQKTGANGVQMAVTGADNYSTPSC